MAAIAREAVTSGQRAYLNPWPGPRCPEGRHSDLWAGLAVCRMLNTIHCGRG